MAGISVPQSERPVGRSSSVLIVSCIQHVCNPQNCDWPVICSSTLIAVVVYLTDDAPFCA